MNDPRFEVYPRKAAAIVDPLDEPALISVGDFGWRFRAGNGRISGIGGEGFTRRADAHRAVIDFVRDVIAETGTELGAFTGEGVTIVDVDE